ncbi:MAG: membrane protein insertase YidC [Betaproteobacteria bacterium]|nr:membrane protein insertase YidC [Betaproteobacteria bacterium]
MDTQRIIALIVFLFSGMLLMEAWNKQHQPKVSPTLESAIQTTTAGLAVPPTPAAAMDKSAAVPTAPAQVTAGNMVQVGQALPGSQGRVLVTTDLFDIELDRLGADLRQVTLKTHLARGDNKRPFKLMQDKVGAYFIGQSGLLGAGLPAHTATWISEASKYELGDRDSLEVAFTNRDTPGIVARKVFTFKRGSYVVNQRLEIRNETGSDIQPGAYFQFLRDHNPPEGESQGNMFTGIVTFTGPAVFTDSKKFQKVEFSQIDKGKQDHVRQASDGWIAMVQHYFVSAWLPAAGQAREYFVQKWPNQLYSMGYKVAMPSVPSGRSGTLETALYLGPQEIEKIKHLAPGLDLVVDYGWLTIIAYPMFVILSWINKIVANWGWTIVIFTILLKLVFFPLNQKAGREMARMRTLAPKIEALRARYGDDKMKLNQGMMELYRSEKVNPLGGCLPILVQMPFLIAMYWVLVGAVELRNAPWIGWITDLSTPDPFYVLPVIMGISMIVQTKLNPAPPDPVQAKVMTIMPIVFSIMFFFFPAGLVLYWTMQNLLGIAQQWYLNKTAEAHLNPKTVGKA